MLVEQMNKGVNVFQKVQHHEDLVSWGMLYVMFNHLLCNLIPLTACAPGSIMPILQWRRQKLRMADQLSHSDTVSNRTRSDLTEFCAQTYPGCAALESRPGGFSSC